MSNATAEVAPAHPWYLRGWVVIVVVVVGTFLALWAQSRRPATTPTAQRIVREADVAAFIARRGREVATERAEAIARTAAALGAAERARIEACVAERERPLSILDALTAHGQFVAECRRLSH